MESRFGQRFGDVRIHDGKEPAKAALHHGARAFTTGRDIVFGAGFYAPAAASGQRLIAHELAHVVQQTRVPGPPAPSPAAEAEARLAGANLAGAAPLSPNLAAAAGIQADLLTREEIQELITRNELKAAQAASQQEVAQLFKERNALLFRLSQVQPVLSSPAPRPAPAPPSPGGNAVRINYPADPHAYSGIELAYTAEGDYPTKDVVSPGVYKSKKYWLAPHLRVGTQNAVYYIAYNPEMKRNEFVIGPAQVQSFLAQENLYLVTAAGAYPIAGSPTEYQALSGRVVARGMAGDLGGAWKAWKASWVAAAKSPQFWVGAVGATAGAFAGEAGVVASESRAVGGELEGAAGAATREAGVPPIHLETQGTPPTLAAPKAPPTPAPVSTPTAATTTEGVFAEIDKELGNVKPAPGDLKGTSQGEFQSPKPLAPATGKPVIRTPGGGAIRESSGASTRPPNFQSASAKTPRSLKTAIRADLGEVEAYKASLEKGEIGLQRPEGANVGGTDYITAIDEPAGTEIVVTDVKTSTVGKHPSAKGPAVKASWQAEVNEAVKPGRLNLGDPALEARIRAAAAAGRVRVRQINVDYSPAGGGSITGH